MRNLLKNHKTLVQDSLDEESSGFVSLSSATTQTLVSRAERLFWRCFEPV